MSASSNRAFARSVTPCRYRALIVASLRRKGWLLIVCTMLFTALSAEEQQCGVRSVTVETEEGKSIELYKESHALLIGVSEYANAAWSDLENIPDEIAKVRNVLIKHGFDVEEHQSPTAGQLKAAFREFVDKHGFKPESRLLVFFSGHGYSSQDKTKGYLVPADAPDPEEDQYAFLKKALHMDQIRAWSSQMEAKHVLFVFDSCFSGAIFKEKAKMKRSQAISRATTQKVRQYITAGNAEQQVPAISIFTRIFIEALEQNKADSNKDGYLTGRELGLYIRQELPDIARRQRIDQDPQYGETDFALGDFVFDNTATLSIETVPKGATIAVVKKIRQGTGTLSESEVIGEAPLILEHLGVGKLELRVEHTGYKILRKTIEGFQPKEQRSMELTLIPESDAEVEFQPDLARLQLKTQLRQMVAPTSAVFSADGRYLLIGYEDDSARLWDLVNGRTIRRFEGHSGPLTSVAFSPDGRYVLTGSDDSTAALWATATGEEVRRFGGRGEGLSAVAFSPGGRYVLAGSRDSTAVLWETATGEEVRSFRGHSGSVTSVAVSPDNRTVLTGGIDGTARLWDMASGKEIHKLPAHFQPILAVDFSPDGRLAATASADHTALLFDVGTGMEHRRLYGHLQAVSAVAFSPNGLWVLTGSDDNSARLWKAASGIADRHFEGHSGWLSSVAFHPDGRSVITASGDRTARIWEMDTSTELCQLISYRDGDWSVIDAKGRFDASNGGDTQWLYWVVNRDDDPVALTLQQLKGEYYEPGLLTKYSDLTTEPLRDVSELTEVALYPSIGLAGPTPENPSIDITLRNRGGGIGRVLVSINGKEVLADARGSNPDSQVKAMELRISLSLADHPYLIPGMDNVIDVRAFNAEGNLSSRRLRKVYRPSGEMLLSKPTLWAIVVGVSNYQGDAIDLRYAAHDASQIATALELGANRLFGHKNVRLALLTTADSYVAPTKEEIKHAFQTTRQAKPWDILVVYFAGHGAVFEDAYYYLTRDARSTSLADPVIRRQVAISMVEVTQWIKESPALKQVMILDTTGDQPALGNLGLKRRIPGGQIRAIERLKDRTGIHVLMGSAADAVSYEATGYEQGLLTYALLQGMSGAALRNGEFIDVSQLFHFAADSVPELASHIGGIQRPIIAAPKGISFDIGLLKDEDRQQIPVAQSKPLLLPPAGLLNAETFFDNLLLTSRIRKQLREVSYASLRGAPRQLSAVYVEADELVGAIRPTGSYRIVGTQLAADLVLVKDGKKIDEFEVQGDCGKCRDTSPELDAVANAIVEAILEAVQENQ